MDLKNPLLEKSSNTQNYKQLKEHNILFTGLTKLISFVRNQKEEEKIQNEQTHQFITESTRVDLSIEKLEKYINENQKDFLSTDFNLFKMFLHMTGWIFVKGFFTSMILESMIATGIFMLDYLTDRLKVYNGATEDKIIMTLLLIGIVVNFSARNILYAQYDWINYKWQAQCKTTLQYLVYKKSLRVKNFCKKSNESQQNEEEDNEKDDDEDDDDPITFEKKNPDINNILTVDTEESTNLYWGLNQTAGSTVVLVVTIVLIYYKIGNSIFNGLYMLGGAMLFNIILGIFINKCYDKIFSKNDDRISLSKDVLEGMKSIKYLGWENIFSKKIKEVRGEEFKQIAKMRILDGILTVFFQTLTYLLLYSFIVSFINDGNSLGDSNVFTIIALFGYLAFPISVIPYAVRTIIKGRVSFFRIKSFLNMKEIDESEVIKTDQQQDSIISNNSQFNSDQIAVKMSSLNFQWPNKEVETQQDNEILQDDNTSNEKKIDENLSEEKNDEISQQNSTLFDLQVDDLQIQKGSLNFVIGKIGSGKTAFLLSILNEMEKKTDKSFLKSMISNENKMKLTNLENKIVLNGSTAYVGQNHWLQTKTIRDNILFGQPYNEQFYNQCLELCQLKVDLSHFYKGDQKVLSSDGNNLSGGQRQRVALCRAIYQDRDIYILDDVFSSLDAHVAESIFKHAIVDYLINKQKKTVILVTSHYGFLKSDNPCNIIYLKHGKVIQDQNVIQDYINYSEQNAEDNHSEFFDERNEDEEEQEYDDLEEVQSDQDQVHNETKKDNLNDKLEVNTISNRLQLQKSESLQQQNDLKLHKKCSKNIFFQDKDEQLEDGEGDNEEYREKGEIQKKTFITYLKSMGLIVVVFQVIAFFLVEALSLFIDFWLRDKMTHFDEQDSSYFYFLNKHFESFQSTFLFLTMVQLVFAFISCILYVITSLVSCYRLYNKLNDVVIYSKMPFYDKNPVGRIINRLSDDVNAIDDDLPMYFQITIEQVAYVIGYPVGIAIQFPWMCVFFILAYIASYFIQNMYRQANREIKRLNSVNNGKLLSHIDESCKGLITIRSMNKQAYMLKSYLEKLTNSVNTYLLTYSLEVWMNVRLLILSNSVQLIVSITAIILIVTEANFNQNVIILCLSYSILFSDSICQVVQFLCWTEQEMISVERIRQYFDNDVEDLNSEKPQLKIENSDEEQNQIDKNTNEKYSISFKNLCITYDEITESNKDQVKYALKNFNLNIKKGEKIAFCGRTGSGKTSLLNCLFRLYEYQQGQIYMDGQDIQSMSLNSLREKMAIIPQFGFLYNASLRDNLDPLEEQTDEKIQNLISEIEDQSQGQKQDECFKDLEFEIQEGGKNLSNGQKQIINFLRVALRKSDIICLDEATSNMDPKTDELIHNKLFELSEGKTLLVITHRLENIDKFDRIVVLDGGQIVECGNIKELRSIEGGFFNRLIKQK